ncbi:MAG: YesL family protein [Lachnospiraceae bacterium]|nr:YesL family protein [Lachnospiraceae bacterium]
MRKFFSPDSIAMRFLTLLCNLMYINLLFIIFSLPLFTMGAAFSAMYSTLFKMLHGDDPFIGKTFVKAFKSSFKQATTMWLPIAIFEILFVIGIYITLFILDPMYKMLQYPLSISFFLLLCISNYIFPQIALFNQTNSVTLKNAVLLAISNFPTTLFMIVVPVILYLIGGLSGKNTVMVFSILMFIGIAAIAYYNAALLRRIFNKLMGEEDAV